jgi:hypothetical protein
MIRMIAVSILAGFSCASAMADSSQVTYSVPVPENLAAYASFNIPAQYTKTADSISVSYVLPQDLTGNQMTVQLQGSLSGTTLEGPNAQATCTDIQNMASCKITYTGLPLDLATTEQYLSSKYTNSTGLKYRQQVAAIFSSEPVGIITMPRY